MSIYKGLCNWSQYDDVCHLARISAALPDLGLTLTDKKNAHHFQIHQLQIRFFLTHNPLSQIPSTCPYQELDTRPIQSIAFSESRANIVCYPRKAQAGVKFIASFIVKRWHASLFRSTERRKVYIVGTWEKFNVNRFQIQKNSWINTSGSSVDVETPQIMFYGSVPRTGGQDLMVG